MDTIKNWKALLESMKTRDPGVEQRLEEIQAGTIAEMRKWSKKASSPDSGPGTEQDLMLAAVLGMAMVQPQGSGRPTNLAILCPEKVPNCIFMTVSAILEEMDHSAADLLQQSGGKWPVICSYALPDEMSSPLEKMLPLLEQCYPWCSMDVRPIRKKPGQSTPEGYIPLDSSGLLIDTDTVSALDFTQMTFSGRVQRGCIRKGDKVNAVDASGKILCPEGKVLALYAGAEEISQAEKNEYVDKICVAIEIPDGDYVGVFLVDGNEALSHRDETKPEKPEKAPPKPENGGKKKKGFWSWLFGM